ncbi:MAG TPA: YciI family protein [Blastocatellia bacterium]|nr:YciI family protein [Blastocatellia bacterium]
MKYILMMNATKADFDWYAKWPKEDLQANFAFMHAFNKELKDSGVLVATEGLAWPDQAKIVRAGSDGAPVITDGPFPEAKEFLAGYWIVDVEGPEQAYRIAARASAAPAPAGTEGTMPIEVRQVMSGPPEELL